MPENGSGRLDRIEAILEKMIEHHNDEFKKLMTWQVLTQDSVRQMAEKVDAVTTSLQTEQQTRKEADEAERQARKEIDKVLDDRVDKLVIAIGKLIERLPPPK